MPGYPLHGLVAAPVTPMSADGGLDLDTWQQLLDFHVREGVDAIILVMHIGESLKLTSDERRQLAATGVEAVGGRVPVYVHVSLAGTDETVALSRHASSVGADGVVAIAPYHWRPPHDVLVEHFVSVAEATDGYVVAYNYPERIGVTVTPAVIAELIERCPNFVGLKSADLDMEYLTEVCRVGSQADRDFAVFTGVEYVLPAAVIGAAGTFSASGGVAPRLVRALTDAALQGRYDEARPLQFRLSELYSVIQEHYPATIKVAMDLLGRPCGPIRQPGVRLDRAAIERVERHLDALGIFDSEPRGWGDAAPAAAGDSLAGAR